MRAWRGLHGSELDPRARTALNHLSNGFWLDVDLHSSGLPSFLRKLVKEINTSSWGIRGSLGAPWSPSGCVESEHTCLYLWGWEKHAVHI